MYPLLGTSFYFSGLFNLRVAERTPSIRTDRRHGQPKAKQNYKGLTARLVAESYRGLLILNWLSFAWVLYRVPFVGKALCFAYYCVVNSYYCFECVRHSERSLLRIMLTRATPGRTGSNKAGAWTSGSSTSSRDGPTSSALECL